MDKFENLKGSELWPEVIAYRLGNSIKADEMQKMAFALKLETLIPNLIERNKLYNPDREYVRLMKERADTLWDTLNSIRDAAEHNPYIEDIIDFSLAHKSDKMDFHDIYWFANAFQGFLQDDLDKIKSGKDSASQFYICVRICLAYEFYLGVAPTCRDTDHTKDAAEASPYESVCMEINRRYNTNLTWSTMRKAKRQYKSYFENMKKKMAEQDKKTITKNWEVLDKL